METAIKKKELQELVPAVDLTSSELPNLQEAKVFPASLAAEYWSPEAAGEFRNCFYQGTDVFEMPNINTPEIMERVECVILLAQLEDKSIRVLTNASKRLVSCLKDAEQSKKIRIGTPLRIVYKGKATNKTNSKESNNWEVNPLSA